MKKAKRWIVSAGACLLALTGMSVSFGQIPTAPIPEQNNDGLPLLPEPTQLDVEPIEPMRTPAAPADVPAPAIAPAVPQTATPAPAPAPVPQQAAVPQTTTAMPMTQQPCQQCNDPCQQCPDGANYSPTPYHGVDSRPFLFNIRPVPYMPAGHEHHGMGMGLGARGIPAHRVPIEPPFYTVRGPRDFYLDKPRPLGY